MEKTKWAVRCKGEALTKTYEFFVEKDFRFEELNQIRFDTKEEAYDAYLKWMDENEHKDEG